MLDIYWKLLLAIGNEQTAALYILATLLLNSIQNGNTLLPTPYKQFAIKIGSGNSAFFVLIL